MARVELIKGEFGEFEIYPMCIDCESVPGQQLYSGDSRKVCPFDPIDGVCTAYLDLEIKRRNKKEDIKGML